MARNRRNENLKSAEGEEIGYEVEKGEHGQTILAYVVLILLSFLCLFFFYILIVNATRSHADLQKGFSAIPGTYFIENLKKRGK